MGTLHSLECSNCDYSAQGSAGEDAGFAGVVETMVCRTEDELVDVLTWSSGYDSTRVGICPGCDGINLLKWDPDLRPCPKCGSPMTIASIGIWD
jgi:hypothetical protein